MVQFFSDADPEGGGALKHFPKYRQTAGRPGVDFQGWPWAWNDSCTQLLVSG
jgi:hypothetical protein